jgi:hypothetical protein
MNELENIKISINKSMSWFFEKAKKIRKKGSPKKTEQRS